MLLAAPFRIGENGPLSSEQVMPQLVLYLNLRASDEIGLPASSNGQAVGWIRKNSTVKLNSPFGVKG